MRITRVRILVSSIAAISLTCLLVLDEGARCSAGSSPGTASEEPQPAEQSGETGPNLIQPSELVGIMKSSADSKPLLIQVGFNVLYVQAHIPGSEFIGPASSPEAVRKLHQRVAALPRTQLIVLYCGCCPWDECPNIKPAFRELSAMGFNNAKLLYITHNFGEDWVKKGYPAAKGK